MIQTRLWIINNFFDQGQGILGGYLNFELFFSIVSENNTFQNGLAKEFYNSSGIATGSSLVLTGVINRTVSDYFGRNNKYLAGWSESKGFLLKLVNL